MMTIDEMNAIKEKRGYSYRQISQYTGIPQVTVQKVLSGKTKNPRQATLNALETLLLSEESIYQGKAYKYAMDIPKELTGVREEALQYEAGERTFAEKKQGEYTQEDYYAIPDERRVELIDGVIYDMSSPTTVHQDIASYIHMCIYNYIRGKKKQCKVFEAPVDVQLDCDNKTMVQPDVLVVCDRQKVEIRKIYGAPDFALEILSPSTHKKDMTIKLAKYMEAGVREYWMIHPSKKTLIKYNFMDEDFVPEIHGLTESVPLAISDDELLIDLHPVLEAIEEFE